MGESGFNFESGIRLHTLTRYTPIFWAFNFRVLFRLLFFIFLHIATLLHYNRHELLLLSYLFHDYAVSVLDTLGNSLEKDSNLFSSLLAAYKVGLYHNKNTTNLVTHSTYF